MVSLLARCLLIHYHRPKLLTWPMSISIRRESLLLWVTSPFYCNWVDSSSPYNSYWDNSLCPCWDLLPQRLIPQYQQALGIRMVFRISGQVGIELFLCGYFSLISSIWSNRCPLLSWNLVGYVLTVTLWVRAKFWYLEVTLFWLWITMQSLTFSLCLAHGRLRA